MEIFKSFIKKMRKISMKPRKDSISQSKNYKGRIENNKKRYKRNLNRNWKFYKKKISKESNKSIKSTTKFINSSKVLKKFRKGSNMKFNSNRNYKNNF
jgi:hypothetical protein